MGLQEKEQIVILKNDDLVSITYLLNHIPHGSIDTATEIFKILNRNKQDGNNNNSTTKETVN